MKQPGEIKNECVFTPTPVGSGPTPQESAWKRPHSLLKLFVRNLVFVAVLMLASCNRTPPAPPPERTLLIFSTVYPLADIARNVGGDHAKVDWLLDLGDPIVGYTLDDRDRHRMAGVDLVLCDGTGRTETWALHAIDRLRETGTVVSVDQTPTANQAPGDGLLYLDPAIASRYARKLAEALASRQPSQGQAFLARAADYSKQIDAVAAGFTVRPGAQVVVLSTLFSPLLTRVGVKQVLVDADYLHLTPRDAEAVRRSAVEAGARSLVVPFDAPPGTVTYLENQTGLKVFALDPLGYPNYDGHSTYLDVLKFNLDQIRLATAW